LKLCQPRISSRKKARRGATGLRIDQAEKFMRRPLSSWLQGPG
jgi:hypothetical protein